MSAMPSPAQSEFSEGSLTIKPSDDVPADLTSDTFPRKPRSVAKQASLALTRFLITFCIGVGATLAWQSYGNTAREVIANASPQFAWLALPAPIAQDAAETLVPAEPAGAPALPSPDQQPQLLSSVSLDLDGVRQSVDRVAANQEQMTRTIGQLVAGQEQMTREIAKLQSIEQYILYKNSDPPPRPTPAAAPKPAARPSPPPPR
jgi:hypothetical protein